MIEIDGVKFDVPDDVAELLRMVSLERDDLKAELNKCLTANARLNDKVCALEAGRETRIRILNEDLLIQNELNDELNQCLTAHAMLNDKVCVLEVSLAEYKYTPQAYDVMWDKVIESSDKARALKEENDELKARIKELEG